MQEYIDYLPVNDEEVFPYLGAGKDSYYYVRSPYQILAISLFLVNHGKLILDGDPTELSAFGKSVNEQNEKYTQEMS